MVIILKIYAIWQQCKEISLFASKPELTKLNCFQMLTVERRGLSSKLTSLDIKYLCLEFC